MTTANGRRRDKSVSRENSQETTPIVQEQYIDIYWYLRLAYWQQKLREIGKYAIYFEHRTDWSDGINVVKKNKTDESERNGKGN